MSNDNKEVVLKDSSSSSRGLGIELIFSYLRLTPTLASTKVQDNMEALNLSIGKESEKI
jgi:hypothetical protein